MRLARIGSGQDVADDGFGEESKAVEKVGRFRFVTEEKWDLGAAKDDTVDSPRS